MVVLVVVTITATEKYSIVFWQVLKKSVPDASRQKECENIQTSQTVNAATFPALVGVNSSVLNILNRQLLVGVLFVTEVI